MVELAELADFGASIVVVIDANGVLTSFNEAAEKVLGYSASEVVGRDWFDVFVPASDRARVRGELLRIFDGGKAGDYTSILCTRDGSRRVIRWQSASMESQGAITGVIGVGSDVTDEVSSLARLRDREYFLSQAQRVGGLGLYVFDILEDRWESSEVMDEIFGIGPEHVRDAAGWLAIVHEADREMMGAYLANLLETRSKFDKHYRIQRISDGVERCVHGLGELELSADGQPLRLIGTIQDVTEQVATMRRFEQTTDTLATAEKIGRVGSWRYDYSSSTIDASEQLLEILGHPRDVPLTITRFFEYIHPDDRLKMSARIASVESSEQKNDYRIVRSDGSVRHLGGRVRVVNGASGEPEYEIGMLADITEARMAELELLEYQRRLKQLTHQLEESGEQERHSLAVHLHDVVAQPLAVAKMRLQLIGSELQGALAEEVEQIAELVNGALDCTRDAMSDIAPSVLYELGLSSALDWLCANFKERHGTTVLLDLDRAVEGLPPTWPQSPVVFRIVRELLTNVAKHSGCSEAIVCLTVDDGQLSVSVTDQGTGFSGLSDTPSGLGLISAREAVECRGGRMTIESHPHVGAAVRFQLPVTQRDG